MKKIMIVFGTRPEAIKMSPLIDELKDRDDLEIIVCVTGQHKEMLDQVLEIFNIVPDYNLNIMKENQNLFDLTIRILERMQYILEEVKPDLVLIHGDTTTTFATALACFYKGIKVGHVEAGLRSHNTKIPFPEEFNRRVVSLISDFDFAPSKDNKLNLLKEGKFEKNIFVTGNTGIDAIKKTVSSNFKHPILEWAKNSRLIILTVHRRENIGLPMENIFRALNRITAEFPDIKIVYPVHLNPLIKELAKKYLANNRKIKLIEPLNVVDFHNFIKKSYLILTDSGGIQEEAPSLDIPVLVLRDLTERQEGVKAGTLKLIGTKEDYIYSSIKKMLKNRAEYSKMSQSTNPYGDGFASKRISDVIVKLL